MRSFSLLLALACCLPLLSCTRSGTPATPRGTVTAEDVRREAREAGQAALALAQQKKQEYQKQIEDELSDLDRQIEKLKAQANEAQAEARAKLQAEIAGLEQKKAAARKELDRVKAASAEAWEDMKEGVNAAMENLRKAYQQARTRFE
jgi:TolA-binding protein